MNIFYKNSTFYPIDISAYLYHMKMILITLLSIFISILANTNPVCSQGSWNPPGADLSFPRTLLDSTAVPAIRETLMAPDILPLYQSILANAWNSIPIENSTDIARISRAMIAKEAAFAVLMDRKYENGTISPMTAADRDSLIRKSRGLLENMNTNVGFQQGWVFYQEWQNTSKELTSYLIAYDLLRGAGVSPARLVSSRDSLIHFTANLYHRAMDTYTILILQFKFFNFQFNNHSIMTASALGLAAIVLNDLENPDPDFQPQNWIDAGMWNLDNSLWVQGGSYPRVSEPDTLAGYAEGPGYFSYAFQNAFPFIRAMGNFLPEGDYPFTLNQTIRQIPNPWYDSRYDRLYDWMNKIRLPDGSFPAIHDSPAGFGTTITALSGKPRFNISNPTFTPDDPFIRSQYIATNVSHGLQTDSLFQPLPAAGSLVFRSTWAPEGIYLHFIAKHGIALTGAKSHHQGDAGSFSLFAYGQLLALDPGYPGAAQSDAVNKPTDHNLILVNGNGPNPPNGEFVNTTTNTASIENYFDSPSIGYGEVNASYYGAGITRKILFVHDKYFISGDFISSAAINNYTFQLHGNGLSGALPTDATGAFYPDFANSTVMYQRDSVHLLALVRHDGTTEDFATATDSMAIGANSYRHYTKTLVTRSGISNMLFLSTLYPWIGSKPIVNQVNTGNDLIANLVSDGTHTDCIFAQHDHNLIPLSGTATGFAETIKGNGNLNLYSIHTDGSFSGAFLQNGDSLVYGLQTVISCDPGSDVAFEKISDGIYTGYVSSPGQVAVFSDQPLQAVSGPVSGLTYIADRNLCLITFTGKGNFRLEPADGLRDEPGLSGLKLEVFPNPSKDGMFTIIIHSHSGSKATFTIANIMGQTIQSGNLSLPAGETQFEVDLSGYPAGIYRLRIVSGLRRVGVGLVRAGR
jgi:hypothetical protein